MKTAFPTPAPTIEIMPGVHATLLHDFDKYSNGSMFIGQTSCNIGTDGKKLGTMDTDITGRWFVTIGTATYAVPMKEIFGLFLDAHTAPAKS